MALEKYHPVQELIKESSLISIPQRYVVSDQVNVPYILKSSSATANSVPELPIIDLKLMETSDMELDKLHSFCKNWGFFQMVNHGVSSSLMDELKYEMEEFYKLPLEEKMKINGEIEGYGTIVRAEGKLEWGDRILLITNPIHIRKQHLFNELPSSLRNTLEVYLVEMQKLSRRLLGYIAKAIKMEWKEMEEMFENGMQSVRLNYYPPCPQPELAVGLVPHSDASAITILTQLDGVDGLNINKDGDWLPLSFVPGGLAVIVGDILEVLSNGIYKSLLHCVTVNSQVERKSIAVFVNPKLQAEIGPATSLINSQNRPIFRRVKTEKYVKDFFSRKLQGKLFLDEYMKIKTSDESTTFKDT